MDPVPAATSEQSQLVQGSIHIEHNANSKPKFFLERRYWFNVIHCDKKPFY